MTRKDVSPVRETCPMIDEVIAFIESTESEDISRSAITDIVHVMEEIRKANRELREWGNDEYYNALDEIENLNDNISDLQKEINELNNQLAADV